MIEIHPFGNFVPKNTRYLVLGSFTTKPAKGYEWFYANGRNQFWPILEKIYGVKLDTKEKQQDLFVKLEMALADIILSCERKKNSNLDKNLINIVFNTYGVESIIKENNVEKIFFTSRFVETLFKKQFKAVGETYSESSLICLPSPSPRYAAMTKEEKIKKYKKVLPKLK